MIKGIKENLNWTWNFIYPCDCCTVCQGINVIDVDTICGIWGVLGILFIIAKIGDITIMFNDDALGSIAEEHEKENGY